MGTTERNAPSIANPMLQAIHATNATYATDGRGQDSGKNRSVPDAPTPVDNPEFPSHKPAADGYCLLCAEQILEAS